MREMEMKIVDFTRFYQRERNSRNHKTENF